MQSKINAYSPGIVTVQCHFFFFMIFFSGHIIYNVRGIAREFSHSEGQPRTLQHITVRERK